MIRLSLSPLNFPRLFLGFLSVILSLSELVLRWSKCLDVFLSWLWVLNSYCWLWFLTHFKQWLFHFSEISTNFLKKIIIWFKILNNMYCITIKPYPALPQSKKKKNQAVRTWWESPYCLLSPCFLDSPQFPLPLWISKWRLAKISASPSSFSD